MDNKCSFSFAVSNVAPGLSLPLFGDTGVATNGLPLPGDQGVDLEKIMTTIEGSYIKKAMENAQGNKSRAADLLGLSLRSMRYRVSKLIESD